MQIKELRLNSFRNFDEVIVKPDAPLNLFYGGNGAGKSSLLEAFYVLSFGRSFRTTKLNNLFHQSDAKNEAQFTIFLEYEYENQPRKIGFSRNSDKGNLINIDGEKSNRLVDIARQLPVQLFTPQSSDLITGPPITRRRYLDWLVFHVEHDFGNCINAYTKSVAQRNSILKNAKATFSYNNSYRHDESEVWTKLIIDEGTKVDAFRNKYVSLLNNELNALYHELFSSEIDVEIRYNKGWPSDLTLEEALEKNQTKDINFGFTTVGPHKADLQFFVNGKKASEYMSRGQLRILVSLLLIAEVNVLRNEIGKTTLLLIDDIGAELDIEVREKLIAMLINVSPQILITAIDKQQFGSILHNKNKKMFHVKHNNVYEE